MDGKNVVVLDSEEERQPSEEEVREYAEFLGIDVDNEPHLLWIAREGVVAPVPPPWKVCTENGEDVFYFNFESGESVWDHPCDAKYRQIVEDNRRKGDKTGGSSLESGMSSKLETSCNSPTSPMSPPRPRKSDAPAKASDDLFNKMDADGDGVVTREEFKKFQEQEEKKGSCPVTVPGSSGSPGPEVVVNEVSDEESASSEAASRSPSAPRSARSNASDSGAVEVAAAEDTLDNSKASMSSTSGAAAEGPAPQDRAPQTRPQVGLAASQRGLLEATGADVVVDLATESFSQDPASSLASPANRSAASASVSASAALGASGGPGGEDASAISYSEAAVTGWRTIVAPLVQQAATASRTGEPSEATIAAWQRLVEPLCSQAAAAAVDGRQRSGSTAPSEVSEDFLSEREVAGRSSPMGDTLELSVSATMDAEEVKPSTTVGGAVAAEATLSTATAKVPSHTDSGADEEVTVQSSPEKQPACWQHMEAELESLSRCLAMLRDVREKQSKYLQLLQECGGV